MSLDKKYLNLFIKVTEVAAYEASLFKGKGDKIAADQSAVNAMRRQLNLINMKGKIVIGEGELDEAPMLYIGEKVGNQGGEELDIAVDPVEGTNFLAQNLPNALSVLAVAQKGNLLNAPETYMEKIAVGPGLPKGVINLNYSIKKNIDLLSQAKNTTPNKLRACVLDRPRHKKIISELKALGVKIEFIKDGDVWGVISVTNKKHNIDIYIGTGGGPEGVLAAAALSCLNCQMQGRLLFQNEIEKNRAINLGIKDLNRVYNIDDMIRGDVIFSATGITDGPLLSGVKNHKDFFEVETLLLHKYTKTNKKILNRINK